MVMTRTERIQSLLIDSDDMDLVITSGDLVHDDDIHSSVAHQLALRYGSSPANPAGGCKIYTIEKAITASPEQARQYLREALQAWVDDDRITDLEVDAEVPGYHRLLWEVGYVDSSDERTFITLPIGESIP